MTADPGGQAGASADGQAGDGRSGNAHLGNTSSAEIRSGDAPSGDASAGVATSGETLSGGLRTAGTLAEAGLAGDASAFDRRDGNGGSHAQDGAAEELETGEDGAGRARPKKAPNAFRTISEVADDLHIPQHVLRFWETKFHQVKPMKRGGGRRYYRPDDIALLRRISDLLYIQGYTIKGVQRLLREGGGRLSEDIPPAPAGERASAEAEFDGLLSQFSDPQVAPDPLIPGLELAQAAMPEATPSPRAGPRRRPDPEAERLRAVLAETLAELEAIRALLG